jgi:hypothetical protein
MTLLQQLGLIGPYSRLSVEDKRKYQTAARLRYAEKRRLAAKLKYDPVKAAQRWKSYAEKNREALRLKSRRETERQKASRIRTRKFLTDEERREYARRYSAKRYRSDPQYRIALRCRTRLNEVCKRRGHEKSTTLKIDRKSLVEWLESKFQPGMTWENHGKVWHIDHIIPCAEFDLTDPKQVEQCFGYFNLQPLWTRDNLVKNAKMLKQQEFGFATTSQ